METTRLGEVIALNKGLLARARELNRRVGEIIFPVMDKATLSSWLMSRLSGARRVTEVQNPDALRLPELDQAAVARVLSECPDTITVLGADLPVEYRGEPSPRVTLGREQIDSHVWQKLPDAGVKLPGGRPVEVVVSFGYYTTFAEADIPRLKAKVRDHLNQSVWDRWPKPEVELPDMADEAAVIPSIVEQVYGQCVVTGDELKAYGVVVYNTGRWYASHPYFKGEWFRSREEAEAVRVDAVAKLEGLRKEIREKAQVEAAKAQAEAAKEELRSLLSREGWYDLEYDLRRRVEDRQYASIPSGLEELVAWVSETLALKAQAEAALATLAQRKAQAERERLAAEQEAIRLAGTLPEGLVDAFGGDGLRAAAFWTKVRGLDLRHLDDHIVHNCGRARVRDHLVEVSGDSDFFCGVDPNAVAHFIGRLMDGEYRDLDPAPVSKPATKSTAPAQPTQSGGFSLADLVNRFGSSRR